MPPAAGKCYTADVICSVYVGLIDCIRKAMKGRMIECSPVSRDIYFLESHSGATNNAQENNLENLFVSPAGREMLKYKPTQTKLKQQKTNPNLEFFTSSSSNNQKQKEHQETTKSATSTKIDLLYEEAAAILGLSCTQTDDCRCIECQGHYFDFEEEIDFPAAADYAGKLLEMDRASSCSIQ